MMRRIVGSSLTALMFGTLVLAQPQGPPKPGPEVKPLGYFVGKWKSEGDMKEGPMGTMTSMGLIAYRESDKAYTYYGVDSMGMADLATGHKKGNTWSFTSTTTMGGKTFQSRYTMVETSPTSYTFKWEMSPDKKTWSVVMEGKATKG
jgi:hypothetical protein